MFLLGSFRFPSFTTDRGRFHDPLADVLLNVSGFAICRPGFCPELTP